MGVAALQGEACGSLTREPICCKDCSCRLALLLATLWWEQKGEAAAQQQNSHLLEEGPRGSPSAAQPAGGHWQQGDFIKPPDLHFKRPP